MSKTIDCMHENIVNYGRPLNEIINCDCAICIATNVSLGIGAVTVMPRFNQLLLLCCSMDEDCGLFLVGRE